MPRSDEARPAATTLVAAAAAFLLLVVFSTTVTAAFWSPRAAVALILLAVGLACLVRIVAAGGAARLPATVAAALLGWAALATILSDNPAMAFFGRYNEGTGLLFVAALVAAWACGVAVPVAERALVERAVVAGILLNCGVAVLQAGIDLSTVHLGLVDGRSAGTLGNPVHLGAVAAGGLALLAPRVARRRAAWAPAVIVAAAAVEVSGARSALAIAAALVGYEGLRRGWRTAGMLAVLVAAGIGLGAAVFAAGPGAAGSAATSRVVASGGIAARTGSWAAGLRSMATHPLVGVGPGRFEAATSPRRTLALARAEGSGREFTDAHDLVVEYGTTIGVPGLALLLAWLALAARRARGPMLVFAGAVAAAGMVEPQSLATTVVAALALGCSGPESPLATLTGPRRVATAALVATAVAAGAVLLVGDHHLAGAVADQSVAHARAARRMLPPWPDPETRLALALAYHAIAEREPGAQARSIAAFRRAAERDPSDPLLWNRLAGAELSAGRVGDAEGDYRRSLASDPWFGGALTGLGRALTAQGRDTEALPLFRRSLLVQPDQPSVRTIVERAGR